MQITRRPLLRVDAAHGPKVESASVALRVLVFLRHGEYDTSDTGTYNLTARGREQAMLSGKALLGTSFDKVYSSTMVRARETAEIVCAELGAEFSSTRLLCEGVPTRVKGLTITERDLHEDKDRFDEAFEKYVRPTRKPSVELLVCHANLIRYFATRALKAKSSTWTRMMANHCGITRMCVLPGGAVRLMSYNETGHIPLELRT